MEQLNRYTLDKGELILTEKALGCGPNHTLEACHCLDCLKPMEQLNRYNIPWDKGENPSDNQTSLKYLYSKETICGCFTGGALI
jgi:hypothetical protein